MKHFLKSFSNENGISKRMHCFLFSKSKRNYLRVFGCTNLYFRREMYPHSLATTFSKKKPKKNQAFLKLKNFFLSINRDTYAKLLMKMFNENKGPVKFDFCLNFAFIRCYLQTKTFTWKRDCVIFSKPQHTMTFTETILESNCKILQSLWKRATLKQTTQ